MGQGEAAEHHQHVLRYGKQLHIGKTDFAVQDEGADPGQGTGVAEHGRVDIGSLFQRTCQPSGEKTDSQKTRKQGRDNALDQQNKEIAS